MRASFRCSNRANAKKQGRLTNAMKPPRPFSYIASPTSSLFLIPTALLPDTRLPDVVVAEAERETGTPRLMI
ncbi:MULTISPECIES: hypothetical protein [Geobacillus]|uniref:Uncharacterized protein n=1 Tax=Geobacillus icigianus TaxID=1430331 RepID=A0ABU6BFW6_9BACL|nr:MULTISPECIES: hypothetical protein [Geobacillus]KYD26066.1 hypothetical protein B4113_1376 [Geobacillus sp. B4113_201601]MEB3750802.1 hypothetical protein [Geobacillus icigianus]